MQQSVYKSPAIEERQNRTHRYQLLDMLNEQRLGFGPSPHGGTRVLFFSMAMVMQLCHFLRNTIHSFHKYACVNNLCHAWIHPQLLWLCS